MGKGISKKPLYVVPLALCQSVSLRFVTFDARLEVTVQKLMSEAGA